MRLKNHSFTVALVMSAMFAGGSVAWAQTPNAQVTVPRISCPRIDGDLTDLAWTEASQLNAKVVMDVEASGYSRTKNPRIAYFGYDGVAMYFAFIDFSPDASKITGNPAKNFNQGDSVEIYIQWDRKDPHAYVQLGISANGQCLVRAPDGKDRPVSGLPIAVKKESIRWTTEVAIPFKFLGVKPPKPGDVWGFNLCGRQVAFKTDYSGNIAWNPCYGAFENTTRFATAVFGD